MHPCCNVFLISLFLRRINSILVFACTPLYSSIHGHLGPHPDYGEEYTVNMELLISLGDPDFNSFNSLG